MRRAGGAVVPRAGRRDGRPPLAGAPGPPAAASALPLFAGCAAAAPDVSPFAPAGVAGTPGGAAAASEPRNRPSPANRAGCAALSPDRGGPAVPDLNNNGAPVSAEAAASPCSPPASSISRTPPARLACATAACARLTSRLIERAGKNWEPEGWFTTLALSNPAYFVEGGAEQGPAGGGLGGGAARRARGRCCSPQDLPPIPRLDLQGTLRPVEEGAYGVHTSQRCRAA